MSVFTDKSIKNKRFVGNVELKSSSTHKRREDFSHGNFGMDATP